MTKKRSKSQGLPRPQPPTPDAAGAAPRQRLWLAAALVAAGMFAYSTSFSGVLVLDDIRAIAQNLSIRTLWPLSVPLSPPGESTVAGRPVGNLSFAVNYALAPSQARDVFVPIGPSVPPGTAERFLENIWGYHAFNLAVHLAAGLLLFGVVRRTLARQRFGDRFREPAATALAFATALIWIVHPLNTAAGTYVVQRVESLMAMFYLLTLYCAIRVARDDEPVREGRRGRWGWTSVAIASCALGMATKEVMVTAPVVVALWLHVFADVRERRLRPLLVGLAASWVVFVGLVANEHRAPSIAFTGASAWSYLLTQAEVIVHYLWLSLVPTSLVFLYTWPLATSPWPVLPQAALLVLLLALTIVGLVRRHPLAFAGAWFFTILAPSSSIVPIVTEVAAEHRMYLPLAGVVACAVVVAYLAWQHATARGIVGPGSRMQAGLALGIVLTAAVAVPCVALTRERNRDYWSAERLWGDTVAKQPQNPRARVAFGEALAATRKFADAEVQFRAAVDLAPADPVALVRLGGVLAAQRKLDESLPFYARALAVQPDDADAHRALGLAYAMRGQDRKAVPHLERAIAAHPEDAFLLGQLATVLVESPDPSVRNVPRAIELAGQAVGVTARRDPMALEILSVSLAAADRVSDAAAAAAEALALARQLGNPAIIGRLEQRIASYNAFLGAFSSGVAGPGPRAAPPPPRP